MSQRRSVSERQNDASTTNVEIVELCLQLFYAMHADAFRCADIADGISNRTRLIRQIRSNALHIQREGTDRRDQHCMTL